MITIKAGKLARLLNVPGVALASDLRTAAAAVFGNAKGVPIGDCRLDGQDGNDREGPAKHL